MSDFSVTYELNTGRILGIFKKSEFPDDDHLPGPKFDITEREYERALAASGDRREVNFCDPVDERVFYRADTVEQVDRRSLAMSNRIAGLVVEIIIRRGIIDIGVGIEADDPLEALLLERLRETYPPFALANPVDLPVPSTNDDEDE